MNDYITQVLDALYAALALPAGLPGPAGHPQGTPERVADDLRRLRMWRARADAIATAHCRVAAVLRAAARVRPQDEHLRDLRRVWVTSTPCWRPCAPEAAGWAAQQDAALGGHAGRR